MGQQLTELRPFFQPQELPEIEAIPKKNRYNMDECVILKGGVKIILP